MCGCARTTRLTNTGLVERVEGFGIFFPLFSKFGVMSYFFFFFLHFPTPKESTQQDLLIDFAPPNTLAQWLSAPLLWRTLATVSGTPLELQILNSPPPNPGLLNQTLRDGGGALISSPENSNALSGLRITSLQSRSSKCGPGTSYRGLTWELVRNADFRAPPGSALNQRPNDCVCVVGLGGPDLTLSRGRGREDVAWTLGNHS